MLFYVSGIIWESEREKVKALYTKAWNNLDTKSRPAHEECWLNMGGPSSKAKYGLSTDSEQVP